MLDPNHDYNLCQTAITFDAYGKATAPFLVLALFRDGTFLCGSDWGNAGTLVFADDTPIGYSIKRMGFRSDMPAIIAGEGVGSGIVSDGVVVCFVCDRIAMGALLCMV